MFESYHVNMLNLEDLNTIMTKHILNKGFTFSLSGQTFTRMPCDREIEKTSNQVLKETGGLPGKIRTTIASDCWMRINHLMAALREIFLDHVDFGIK